jgi:hypothetical protein
MSVEMEYRTCCILRTTIVEDTNYTEKYWFGSGWTLAFPFIEEHDMGAYLFHEDGQVFEFDWYSGKFQSYGLKDLQINTNDSPIINGVTVYYTLTYKDGTKWYFDEYGRIISKRNRFGDAIDFTYVGSGDSRSIDYIIDSLGRKVDITYLFNEIKVGTATASAYQNG